MQGASRVSERLGMFMALQQLIHNGRVGDSVAMLDQQLDEAFEVIVANYADQSSFHKFFAYFRKHYMQRKGAPYSAKSPRFEIFVSDYEQEY